MTEPPPKERLPDASHTHGTIQEGGGAEVEPGEGMEGQVHVGMGIVKVLTVLLLLSILLIDPVL